MSKIDPYDTAFPVPVPAVDGLMTANDLSLNSQVTHPPTALLASEMQTSIRKKERSPERKPFKQTNQKKNLDQSPLPGTKLKLGQDTGQSIQSSFVVQKKATNKGMQNSIESASLNPDFDKTQTSFVPMQNKYGKNFKIPELPPVLQAQLMTNEKAAKILSSNRHGQDLTGSQSPMAALAQTEGQVGTQYKIKKFIDDIYQKEMKYRYHKQYVREDYLHVKSPIFDLKSYHKLKPREDIIGIPEVDEDNKNPMAASESLS